MATLKEAKKKGPVVLSYVERQLSRGGGASPDVFARLVGMILRGESFATTTKKQDDKKESAPVAVEAKPEKKKKKAKREPETEGEN